MSLANIRIRLAEEADAPALRALIEASVRGLQAEDYTQAQIEGALGHALGLDTQLIADRSYFAAEATSNDGETSDEHKGGGESKSVIVGCGGWSMRRTLFGSDHGPEREAGFSDPAVDAAKIRAIFVHPACARRGIGSLILEHCEEAARRAGFRYFEMGSTLTGVPLYTLRGYREVARIAVPLPNGERLAVVRMRKGEISSKSE